MVKNILLSGTMRSGTTLMSSVLGSHPEITMIPDVVKWYWNKVYLDYNSISTVYELDMILYELAPFIYHGLREDQIQRFINGEVRKKIISRGISYYSIYETLVEIYNPENKPSKIIGSKATHISRIYAKFIEQFENPLIIHMIRDCRDVYYSHKTRVHKINQNPVNKLKKIFQKGKNVLVENVLKVKSPGLYNRKSYLFNNPMKIMDDWVYTNLTALNINELYPENIIIVKYEEFVTDPGKHIKNIFNKIGISNLGGAINYNELKDRDGNAFQANTSHNVDLNKISNKNIYHSHSKISQSETQYYYNNISEAAKSFGY